MRITWNEMTINPDGIDFDELLQDWRWLVPEEMEPVVVTALGDLFLRDAAETVYWLDTGAGQLNPVAESVEAFKQLMQQPERANNWFLPQLIGDLIEAGKTLQPGECYSCDVPPGLGGQFAPENINPTDIRIHFSMNGQIFEQTKHLPEGTPISGFDIQEDGK